MKLTYLFLLATCAFAQDQSPPEGKLADTRLSVDDIIKARDPFRAPDLQDRFKIPKDELQRFPVHEFKLIGVVTGPDEIRAMLQSPGDKTYFVKGGDKIGQQEGVVTQITEDAVYVRETVVNLLGRKEKITTSILLPSEFKDE